MARHPRRQRQEARARVKTQPRRPASPVIGPRAAPRARLGRRRGSTETKAARAARPRRPRLCARQGRAARQADQAANAIPTTPRRAGGKGRRQARQGRRGAQAQRTDRQGHGPRRHRLAPRGRAADRPGQGGGERPASSTRPPTLVTRDDVITVDGKPIGGGPGDARLALSQARRPGDLAQRPGRPSDGVRRPAQRPAARDLGRASGPEHRRPAAADQRRRAEPRAGAAADRPGAPVPGPRPRAASPRPSSTR